MPGGALMAVPVTPGPQWGSAAPGALFRLSSEIENYDVTPDGSRFLIGLPAEKDRESPLRVVLNFPTLLKSGK